MKSYFQKLYQFNVWADKRVLSTLRKQSVQDEKILSLLGHYIVAQFFWLYRIKGLPIPDYKLWGNYPFEQLEKMSADVGKLWLEFIEKNEDFNRELTYKNFAGDLYSNNIDMIMIHVVNHSSYHRAQIALLLREKGFEAINTDFITYDRVIRGEWKD